MHPHSGTPGVAEILSSMSASSLCGCGNSGTLECSVVGLLALQIVGKGDAAPGTGIGFCQKPSDQPGQRLKECGIGVLGVNNLTRVQDFRIQRGRRAKCASWGFRSPGFPNPTQLRLPVPAEVGSGSASWLHRLFGYL